MVCVQSELVGFGSPSITSLSDLVASQPTSSFQKKLSSVQFLVAKAMRENPDFRKHGSSEKIWLFLRCIDPKIKWNSVDRCQRKLWEIAYGRYLLGDFDFAFNFLPEDDGHFHKIDPSWLATRRVYESEFRQFFGVNGDE